MYGIQRPEDVDLEYSLLLDGGVYRTRLRAAIWPSQKYGGYKSAAELIFAAKCV